MSEIAIKPWMRLADEAEPIPDVAEITLVYEVLRAHVEAAFRESDEGTVRHDPHKGNVCEMVIELETDDYETIEFKKRTMPGIEEHEIAITSSEGIRNTYIGSSILQLVTRTDEALPSEVDIEAEMSSMEAELEFFLRTAAGETVEAADSSKPFGVTVGQPEMEHFMLYLSDGSVE